MFNVFRFFLGIEMSFTGEKKHLIIKYHILNCFYLSSKNLF